MSFYRIVLCVLLSFCAGRVFSQTATTTPDTITFKDGEQLAGKLVSVLGGTVTFHSVNLITGFLNESWNRTFSHNIKFNEYITLTPAFNIVQAYSAVGNASFIFPIYKKFNLTVSSTDNCLGDPPEGFHRNSFQFTSGVTYVIK
jgi:hypothetical protein